MGACGWCEGVQAFPSARRAGKEKKKGTQVARSQCLLNPHLRSPIPFPSLIPPSHHSFLRQEFPTLVLKVDEYTYPNGKAQQLLCAEGTLPMYYLVRAWGLRTKGSRGWRSSPDFFFNLASSHVSLLFFFFFPHP